MAERIRNSTNPYAHTVLDTVSLQKQKENPQVEVVGNAMKRVSGPHLIRVACQRELAYVQALLCKG